jgi:DNA-binding transcriptional LysR family regulator
MGVKYRCAYVDSKNFSGSGISMEMHQVRYFLAVARELNFTRAAESCNVAQPSLTRAIKQLEDEFGGELFRRERNLSHLTELGQRMQPMLQQCYDSALTAKSLAQSIKKGGIAPLPIALSTTVNIMLLIPFLTELVRVMPGLELRFYRGANAEVAEFLKKGDAEVAVAGLLEGAWDRLDSWHLFSEPYRLVVGREHHLAAAPQPIDPAQLSRERMLCRNYCDNKAELNDFLVQSGGFPEHKHDIWTEQDLTTLLAANLGIAIMPQSSVESEKTCALSLKGLTIERKVCAYGVAGRQRSMAASTLIKMLRAADWRAVESASLAAESSSPTKAAKAMQA